MIPYQGILQMLQMNLAWLYWLLSWLFSIWSVLESNSEMNLQIPFIHRYSCNRNRVSRLALAISALIIVYLHLRQQKVQYPHNMYAMHESSQCDAFISNSQRIYGRSMNHFHPLMSDTQCDLPEDLNNAAHDNRKRTRPAAFDLPSNNLFQWLNFIATTTVAT